MVDPELVVRLHAPQVYPAISSAAKSSLSPVHHLRIVTALSHPNVLVSAYDIGRAGRGVREETIRLLEKIATAGGTILLDSGGYERHWLRDTSWRESDFLEVIPTVPAHVVMTFDGDASERDTASSIELACLASEAARRVAGDRLVVPIVHGATPAQLLEVFAGLHRRIGASIYACPERETGDGVLAGCSTVGEIRAILGCRARSPVLHLLGAGNPLSILAYASAGANSFDGLDWCQTVADFDTGTLHHSRQLDFFAGQSRFGGETAMSYSARVLAHNLTFMRHWNGLLATAADSGDWGSMLAAWLPKSIARQLSDA